MGLVKKISVLPRTKETCVIEIWQPEQNPHTKIRSLQYLKDTVIAIYLDLLKIYNFVNTLLFVKYFRSHYMSAQIYR